MLIRIQCLFSALHNQSTNIPMSNSDTVLDAIKKAESSLAKLTMEDKDSHPPPDIISSLCTQDLKRLKLSNTAASTTIKTAKRHAFQV